MVVEISFACVPSPDHLPNTSKIVNPTVAIALKP